MLKKKIDIILPTYYEQDNISKVFREILDKVKTPNIITAVIQDRKDPTIPIIREFQSKYENIQIVYTKNGKGMLKALKEGIRQTNNSIIVTMMADLSDNPGDIDKMVHMVENGYDLACASRYSKKGKRVGGPILKGILSYLSCKSLRLLTHIPTDDATNAFKCFKRSAFNSILIESREGFEMPLELSVKFYAKGFKIGDVPTVWRDRVGGRSKFNLYKTVPFYLKWYFYGLFRNR